eukprot:g77827.t1
MKFPLHDNECPKDECPCPDDERSDECPEQQKDKVVVHQTTRMEYHDDPDSSSPHDKEVHRKTSSPSLTALTNIEEEPLHYLKQQGYHQIRRLSKSLYGEVLYAEHRVTGKRVAIKTSRTASLNTKWESPQLEYELLQLAHRTPTSVSWLNPKRLPNCPRVVSGTHPFLIRPLAYQQTTNWCYSFLEYCPQGDLFDYTARRSMLHQSAARHVLLQVMAALAHLHSLGIYHLDVSLENMFLVDGVVKLADLGCARQWSPQLQARFPTHRPGKWGYMSPEVYERQPVDGELADVWSLGASLFIMLSGRAPYRVPRRDDRNFTRIYIEQNYSGLPFSREAQELLSHMLCPARHRWRLHELLSHPFFAFSYPYPISSPSYSLPTPSSSSSSSSLSPSFDLVLERPSPSSPLSSPASPAHPRSAQPNANMSPKNANMSPPNSNMSPTNANMSPSRAGERPRATSPSQPMVMVTNGALLTPLLTPLRHEPASNATTPIFPRPGGITTATTATPPAATATPASSLVCWPTGTVAYQTPPRPRAAGSSASTR